MAALEYRVLSEILRTKNFQTAIVSGLKKEHFKDPEARQIFTYVWNHYYSRDTPKQVPLVESVKKRWPSFEMTGANKQDSGAALSLIKELKFAALSTDMDSLAREFTELVAENPEDALKIMRNQLAHITYSFESKGGFGIGEIVEGVKEQYDGARKGTIYGTPWPWDILTADTLGKNKGDLIVFYGRMKSMKSWLLFKAAVDDFVIHKQRVLVWSREMGPVKMKLRLGSILANVDYQCLKKGDLPRPLYKRAIDTLEALDKLLKRSKEEVIKGIETGAADLIVLCGRDAPRTLAEFKAAIDMYSPDVVYVDSFYHMESDRVKGNMQHWNKIMLLAEDLKDAAIDFNIPFVISGQANREGEKMAGESMIDVAGADALGREADLVIRVVRKRGADLREEDYEGAWEAEEKMRGKSLARITERLGRPSIQIPNKRMVSAVTNGHGVIPTKAQEKSMRRPRICAEIALLPNGNREGTLEGFIIRAIPGYDWRVLRENVSPNEVKEWLGTGKKLGRTDKNGRPSGDVDSYRDTAKGLQTSRSAD